jgi:hypothetical protein
MTERYQMVGILVQGDESKAARFDLSCQGDSIWLYGYTTSDNFASGTPQLNIWRSLFKKGTVPLYLRLTRIGNSYFVMDSTDGEWGTRVGGFTFEMKVLRVGIYVGNFGFPAPEFTGIVDYFFDMTKPLANDDATTSVVDTTGPLVYDVNPVSGQQSIALSWKTDEPATSTVEYGPTTSYGSSVVDTAMTLLHSVTINGLQQKTTYNLRITANDKRPANATSTANFTVTTGMVQAVGSDEQPAAFVLHQNYPNPFNAGTVIGYSLAGQSHVALRVFNSLGEEVRTLIDQQQQAGEQVALWDGKNLRGETVPSGIYFYRLQVMPSSAAGAPSRLSEIRKMVYLK